MSMLVNPHGFDPNLIGVHTYHNGLLYTFIFLAKNPETKIMDQRAGSDRTGLRKGMLIVALLMIVGGSITMWTNYSIGAEQIANNAETQRYEFSEGASWYNHAK